MSDPLVLTISVPEGNIICLLEFLMKMTDKIIDRLEFDDAYLACYYKEKDNIYERINMFELSGTPIKYCTICKIILQAVEYIIRDHNDEYYSLQEDYIEPLDYKMMRSNSDLAALWHAYCISKVYCADRHKGIREKLITFDKSIKLVGLTGEEICALYES